MENSVFKKSLFIMIRIQDVPFPGMGPVFNKSHLVFKKSS